ncbi:MAG: hypothetical protein FWF84_03405 [Kiritimatiellaeota bacterium]|nr:hypothetical protein [Kiritimatiellota bacterium]
MALMAWGGVAVVWCAVAVGGIRYVERRFPAMRCPWCGGTLERLHSRTECLCPMCGAPLFTLSEDAASPAFAPIEREAVARRNRAAQRGMIRFTKSVASILLLAIIVQNVDDVLHDRGRACFHIVFLSLYMAAFFIGVAGVIRYSLLSGFVCPACAKRINEPIPLALAMTTDKCGFCGKTVLLPPRENPEAVAVSRAEWKARYEAEARRGMGWKCLTCWSWFFFMAPSLAKAMGLGRAGRIAVLVAVVAAMGALLWRRRTPSPCSCPHCGESVAAPFYVKHLFASGRCPHCGGCVLHD